MKVRIAIACCVLVALVAALLWWNAGEARAIATVSARRGEVTRDSTRDLGRWMETDPGDALFAGDGVRTGADGRAELEVGHHAKVETRPSTIFRVYLGEMPDADMRVDLDFGRASLITTTETVAFETELGLARIAPDSQLLVERDGEEGAFVATLESGEARILRLDGVEIVLEAGRPVGGEAPGEDEGAEDASGEASPDAGATGANEAASEPERVAEGGDPRRYERGSGSVTLEVGVARLLPSPGWLSVEVGRAIIETGDEDIPIRIPGADLVARAGGTRASAEVGANALDLEVFTGGVEIHPDRGGEELIGAGETLHFADGELTISGRGPSRVDLVVAAGGTIKILDPHPPSNVGFTLPAECEGQGWVERMRGDERSDWDAGVDQVALRLDAGRHLLRFRCLRDGRPGPVVSRARVLIQQNAGQAPLAPPPPVTEVELDGRTYRVHYQNRLPQIHVRWPRAPGPGPYTLEFTRRGRTQSMTAASADFRLGGRRLGEGDYRLVAKNAEGRPSRPTSIHISFDNAATGASLMTPADGSFGEEEPVVVTGTAVQGARVAIEGGSASVDGAGRFTGRAWVPRGRRGFAVRVSLPGHSPQYFIRRIREGSP